jgi:Ca2+/Na+ antiporter
MDANLLGIPLLFWGMLCLAVAIAYYFVWPSPGPAAADKTNVARQIVLRYFHSLVWVLLAIGCFLGAWQAAGILGRWVALLGIPTYAVFLVFIVRDRHQEERARSEQRRGAGHQDLGMPL